MKYNHNYIFHVEKKFNDFFLSFVFNVIKKADFKINQDDQKIIEKYFSKTRKYFLETGFYEQFFAIDDNIYSFQIERNNVILISYLENNFHRTFSTIQYKQTIANFQYILQTKNKEKWAELLFCLFYIDTNYKQNEKIIEEVCRNYIERYFINNIKLKFRKIDI